MMRFRIPPIYRRHLPDVLAGLAVFAFIVALMGWHLGIALAAGSSMTMTTALDRNATVLLLAGAFAAMTVFNIAFFRHLCRAYVAPRRAAARRAQRSAVGDRT